MNIHVVKPDGSWYCRPDVTLVRDADRFCLPDDCTEAIAFRGLCIRIDKAGKAVVPRFARRYFDSWIDAVLFYGITEEGTATPNLDRATVVSRDFRPVETLDAATLERITGTICRISLHLSLRIGDFIIFEQPEPTELGRGCHIDTIAIL